VGESHQIPCECSGKWSGSSTVVWSSNNDVGWYAMGPAGRGGAGRAPWSPLGLAAPPDRTQPLDLREEDLPPPVRACV
jgi:hypothetical protein